MKGEQYLITLLLANIFTRHSTKFISSSMIDISCSIPYVYMHMKLNFENTEHSFTSKTTIFIQAQVIGGTKRKWINHTQCFKNNLENGRFYVKCRMWNLMALTEYYYNLRILAYTKNMSEVLIPVTNEYYASGFDCFPDHNVTMTIAGVSFTNANISWKTHHWDEKYDYIESTIIKLSKKGNLYQIYKTPPQICNQGCVYRVLGLKPCYNYELCIINTFSIPGTNDAQLCKKIKTLCKRLRTTKSRDGVIIASIVLGVVVILIIISIVILIIKRGKKKDVNTPIYEDNNTNEYANECSDVQEHIYTYIYDIIDRPMDA